MSNTGNKILALCLLDEDDNVVKHCKFRVSWFGYVHVPEDIPSEFKPAITGSLKALIERDLSRAINELFGDVGTCNEK
jgi:hypothetical protein